MSAKQCLRNSHNGPVGNPAGPFARLIAAGLHGLTWHGQT
jgi:hypothetical protein